MKFLTPAFVRVENPQERKELIEWLESIGYEVGGDPVGSIIQAYTDGSIEVWKNGEQMIAHAMPIDCDTNIPLFKALAAMNEDLVRPQWIYDRIRSELCYNHGGYPTMRYRMPTVEEIIEQFRQKNEI